MRPKSSYFDSQKISTFRTAKSWHLSGLEFLLRKWKKSFFCGYSALVSPRNFVMAMLQNFGKGQVCGRGSAPSVQKIFRTDRTLLLQEIKSLALWFFHADTSTFLTELSVVPYGLHTYQGNVLKEDLLFHIGFQSSLRRGKMSQLFLSVFGPYWLRGWLMPLLKGQF